MNSYNKGISVLSTVFKVGDIETDPTTVTFTLTGMGESVTYIYGMDDELVKDSVGNYHVEYTFNDSGYYKYSFMGTGGCEAVDSDYIVIGSTVDLIASTSLELEDASNTIFTGAIIDKGIEAALTTASKYRPREKKIAVTLAASKDVDVSNIHGLIKVLKAEYRVNQDPQQFRNVITFDDTVTLKVSNTPTAEETAYLYCHLVHCPDTLGIELLNIIPKLAAAYCAMNWTGDGRAQIKAAIDTIELINSSTDNITARLAQAATDANSMRTQITALLSSSSNALSNAESRLSTAASVLEDAGTAAQNIDISDELSDAATELDNAINDIDAIRTSVDSNIDGMSNALDAVSTEIGLARTDLENARSLNNKIPVGPAPEAQLHASANAELNVAASMINKLRTQMQLLTGVGERNVISGNEINIATGLLSKAGRIISAYSSQSGNYSAIASREISIANSYVGEARTLISKSVNAINAYATSLRSEIAIANGHLSQAGGYTRELNSRLSVANVITNYQHWGQSQHQIALSELKRLAKPLIYHTYSEY